MRCCTLLALSLIAENLSASSIRTFTQFPFLGTASPDGRYIVVGEALYDRKTYHWSSITFDFTESHTVSVINDVRWLPGKGHSFVVRGSDERHNTRCYIEHGESGSRVIRSSNYNQFTSYFCLLYPQNKIGHLPISLSDVLDWQLLPDGSGLIFLRAVAIKAYDGAGWGVRNELTLYTFRGEGFQQLFLSPWVYSDVGEHAHSLQISPGASCAHGEVSFITGNSQIQFVVNLATKKSNKHDLPNFTSFSPIDRYAADSGTVRYHDDKHEDRILGHYSGALDDWSPDGNYLKCLEEENQQAGTHRLIRIYRVNTNSVQEVFHTVKSAFWAGNDLLWLETKNGDSFDFSLYSLRDGSDRMIFRVKPPQQHGKRRH